jgi:hypothetical protein
MRSNGVSANLAVNGSRADIPKVSWTSLVTIAVASLLSALYVGLVPTAKQTELKDRTWEQFAKDDPEVAALYSMDLALLGGAIGAFSALAIVVAAIPYRQGARWAWWALWIVPVFWGGVAQRMFREQYPAAPYYAVLTVAAAVGLLIPFRSVVRR